MIFLIWGAVALICFYSILFAVTLWKQKNKPGSIVVIMLSIGCLVLPYFTYIK
ncbi:MAG: hypothetical protein WB217_16490 [Mesobacillus sp.]